MLVIYGNYVKTGHIRMECIDLAPTILDILGLQVPEYMDGRVIDILEKNEEGAKTDLGSAFVQTVQNNAHQT